MQNQPSNRLHRKPSWRRPAWLAATIVLALLILLSLVPHRPSELRYAGKTLTQWLLDTNADWFWIPNDVYGHIHDELWSKLVDSMKGSNSVSGAPWSAGDEQATNERAMAVRAMGTNALPHLLRLMSAKPAAATKLRGAIAERLPEKWSEKFYPSPLRDLVDREKAAAFDGFTILGTNAEPALPALSNLLFQGGESLELTWAIANIGPRGIALLTNALSRQPPDRRSNLALALGLEYDDAKSAVPALVDRVERGDATYDVLGALGRIGGDDPRLVPALIRLLEAKDAGTNPHLDTAMAYLVLALQREKARAAAPLVIAEYRRLMGDASTAPGRRFYRRILRAIAPDSEPQLPPPTPDEKSEDWP